jgi:hypothetical protein
MALYEKIRQGLEYVANRYPSVREITRALPDSFIIGDERVLQITKKRTEAERRFTETTKLYREGIEKIEGLTQKVVGLETQVAGAGAKYAQLEENAAAYQQQSKDYLKETEQLRSLIRQQKSAMAQMRMGIRLEVAKNIVYTESESNEFGLALDQNGLVAAASTYVARKLGLSYEELSRRDVYSIVANSGEIRRQITNAIKEKQRTVRIPELAIINREGKQIKVGEAIVRLFYSEEKDDTLEYAAASITTEAAHKKEVLKRYKRMKKALHGRKKEADSVNKLTELVRNLSSALSRRQKPETL